MDLVWCEVDTARLAHNIRVLRRVAGPGVLSAPVVKGNAYGHDLLLAARAFLEGGADWLCVNALYEARALREAGIRCPLYLAGYVGLADLEEAITLGCRLVVYNLETVEALGALVPKLRLPVRVHVKLETGNHRQGLPLEEALVLAERCRQLGIELEGASSHFANVEDTTDHRYAREQMHRFQEGISALRAAGHPTPITHIANSAATVLWPDAQLQLVRTGIISYGLWPSRETLLSAFREGKEGLPLEPALTWKCRIAQLKWIDAGAFVGYGCTYMATRRTRLAILPVGYYDGYDRGLSNLAYVLIGGRRAAVRGRVCMNILMVDVTDIPEVALEDEVVLLGSQGQERISAEQLAEWAGTINYELVTRIGGHLRRVEVRSQVTPL